MNSNSRIILFASKYVGLEVLKFLSENYYKDITAIVLDDKDELLKDYFQSNSESHPLKGKSVFFYEKEKNLELLAFLQNFEADYFILAWWAHIIKKEIISLPKYGVINFHPSLLPYNRGKHPNFWSIVEETPFGVSLHFIDEGVDTGDIIFQKKIEKTWEDTGGSLYEKSMNAIIELFKESYPLIRQHKYSRVAQRKEEGTFHLAKEIDHASKIDLDRVYTARSLLNLLRARTFEGYPSCYFIENNNKYEVRISINNVK